MIKYLLWAIFAVVSEFLTYKFIKRLDQKERDKLQKKELAYIENLRKENADIISLQEKELENLEKLKKIKKEKKNDSTNSNSN